MQISQADDYLEWRGRSKVANCAVITDQMVQNGEQQMRKINLSNTIAQQLIVQGLQ